jgi:hypothetical protein
MSFSLATTNWDAFDQFGQFRRSEMVAGKDA